MEEKGRGQRKKGRGRRRGRERKKQRKGERKDRKHVCTHQEREQKEKKMAMRGQKSVGVGVAWPLKGPESKRSNKDHSPTWCYAPGGIEIHPSAHTDWTCPRGTRWQQKLFWAGQWWYMPLISGLGKQRQADLWVQGQPSLQSEFQDSQGYTEKPCLEKQS